MKKMIHLNGFSLFCPGPNTRLSWVYPEDKIRYQWYEMGYWDEIAKTLERGKFDAWFFADNLGGYNDEVGIRYGQHFPILDPLTIIPRLAAITKNLGFIVTISTTFNNPYVLARKLQSLDHVTEGRIGWNIITSVNQREAGQAGTILPPHDERYERAEEYVQLVKKLWNSWDEDALVMDHKNLMLADPEKVHHLDFEGQWYSSTGPLCVQRGPQGHPVLVQAGSSPEGVAFASRHAEVIFAPAAPPPILKGMVEKWRSAISNSGRDPEAVRILSPVGGVVSNSKEEALERRAEIMERIPYELGLRNISNMAGFDLNDYSPDTKVADILDKVSGMRGPFEMAAKQGETLKDVAAKFQNMVADTRFVGTPKDVADAMEADLEATGADGYQFSPPYYAPDYFRDIVDLLIPELDRRGRLRQSYTNQTLRKNIQQSIS